MHAGAELYRLDGSNGSFIKKKIAVNADSAPLSDRKSDGFMWQGAFYLLDGESYYVYKDGGTLDEVTRTAYIPTTMIASPPSGGGEGYERINLLSPYRVNCFYADGTSDTFQLDAMNITEISSVEYRGADGYHIVTGWTFNLGNGSVKFPYVPQKSSVEGEDNIRITYKKNVPANIAKIARAKVHAFFGMGSDTRVFLAGNPDSPNVDRYSEGGRADYFPDVNYTAVGESSSPIAGYLTQYGELVILKSDGAYFRSAEQNQKGESVFSVRHGLSGVGAVASRGTAAFLGDPVFLSKDGVYGLETSAQTAQRTAQPRSYYIDAALKKERSPENAVFAVHDGFLYLFINGRVYAASAAQKNKNPAGSYGYEWYTFEGVSASCACSANGRLWIGDEYGRVRYFKRESEFGQKAYSDDGEPIVCSWSTKCDDLGDISSFKRILKKGSGAMFMRAGRTSGSLYYTSDARRLMRGFASQSLFDFDAVDFNRFDFGRNEFPEFVPVRTKLKKARLLQVTAENGSADQGFGLYRIRVSYTIAKPIKR